MSDHLYIVTLPQGIEAHALNPCGHTCDDANLLARRSIPCGICAGTATRENILWQQFHQCRVQLLRLQFDSAMWYSPTQMVPAN